MFLMVIHVVNLMVILMVVLLLVVIHVAILVVFLGVYVVLVKLLPCYFLLFQLKRHRFQQSNTQTWKEPPQFCSHAGLNHSQAFPLPQSWMELCQAHKQRLSAWLPPRDWYAAE